MLKQRRWMAGCSLVASVGCGSGPDASAPHAAASEERLVETEAELAERMRREGEILQAALDEVYTPEEQEALLAVMESQSRVDFTGSLTSDETRTILARFATQGISADRVSFAGRMVSVDQSDAYYAADALLEEGESPIHEVEKGYVLSNINTSTLAYGAPQISPALFARTSGGAFQFWRPALSREDFPGVRRKYFLVIDQPNPAMPSHMRQALIDAAASIESANNNSNDCLISNTFEVIDASTWNGFTNGNKLYHYKIEVRYRPVLPNEPLPACGSIAAYACAVFPRQISKSYAFPPSSASASRMSFGSYIGLPSNGALLNPNMSALNRKEFIAHEIGHVLGLSHPFNDGATHLHVPGTEQRNQDPNTPLESPISNLDANTTYDSFMDYDFDDGLNAWPISADDRLTLRKLYPANGCGYTHGFQTIQ